MKTKNYFLTFLVTGLLAITPLTAQVSLETFDDETAGSSTFTSNGQEFAFVGDPGEFDFTLRNIPNAGWNDDTGFRDRYYMDNTFGNGIRNDGAHFAIITSDGTPITVRSFFMRVQNRFVQEPDPYTITIEGVLNGQVVYSFVRDSGFSSVNTFEPNNGYTFIDFAVDGDEDFSRMDVDTINIDTTGDGELIGFDSFRWGPESALSVDGVSLDENNINVFPNPASSTITVSGIRGEENYKIYNVLGAEIARGVASDNETISIQNFSNGLYLINFDNGNSIKFIKR